MQTATKYRIGLFCMAMMNMSLLIVVPTIALTAKDFPEIPIMYIMYLTALPTLFAIPGALITGNLSKKIGSRTVGLLSMVLFFVSGLVIPFMEDFYLIMFMRCFNGLALGFNKSVGSIMLAQLIPPAERPGVQGLLGTFTNGSGIAYSLLSGVIAVNFGWRASYFLYAIAAVLFVVMLWSLPAKKVIDEMQAKVVAAAGTSNAELAKKGFNWGYYWILFLIMICYICSPSIGANMALLIVDNGFGDTAMVGLATSVNVLVAAIAGIFYGKISKNTKRYNFTIGPAVMGLGLGFVGLATSYMDVIVGQVIAGFGWIYIMSESNLLIFGNTTPANRALGISIMVAIINLSQFLSPNVLVPVADIFLGPGPGDRFVLAGLGLIAVGLANIFIDPKKANQGQEEL